MKLLISFYVSALNKHFFFFFDLIQLDGYLAINMKNKNHPPTSSISPLLLMRGSILFL